MKKTFITLIIYGFCVAVMVNSARAQTHQVLAFSDAKDFMSSIRTLYVSIEAADMPEAIATAESKVNNKALRDFKDRFNHVTGEKWYEMPFFYLTYFQAAGIKNRVYYDKKGHWQYTVKSFQEDKLPKETRSIVRSTYFDYEITFVEEIDSADRRVYIVHLEDENSLLNLRVSEDGKINTLAEYHKS